MLSANHFLADRFADQDLGHLKSHFAVVEVQLEFAQTQTVVVSGGGLRDGGPATFRHP